MVTPHRAGPPPGRPTRVVCRVWPDGQLVALLPEVPGLLPGTVHCYVAGHYLPADLQHCLAVSRPASGAEAAQVLAELTARGHWVLPAAPNGKGGDL